MNQILPYPVWVGHVGEARDYKKIFDEGIKALVELAAEEPASQPPREILYCRFPLLDGLGNPTEVLSLAIHTVAELLKKHFPTLVCCGGGVSRAPAIVAAALALVHREAPEVCLRRVAEYHRADMSPGFWSEVTGVLPAE
jgi:hypothetical protein